VTHSPADDELRQLRAALASRPVIDLAKGVLMALHRCDEGTAFAELTRVSTESNTKVARIAQLLVAQVVLPRPADVVDDVPLRACAAVERWVRALPVPTEPCSTPELRGSAARSMVGTAREPLAPENGLRVRHGDRP
jgi:hypothetical protein